MGRKSRDKKLKKAFKSAEPQLEPVSARSIFNRPFLHVVVILITVFLIYSNVFTAAFEFDDDVNITKNSKIKNLNNFRFPSGTRWVGFLTFAINYRFGGMAPFGYHIVNLAIHMLNAVLVYWLVALTLRTPSVISVNKGHGDNQHLAAVFSSLLFLSHPIQTQAVTYIVQRFASLATLFYLLTLVTYIQFRLSSGLKTQKMRTAAKDYTIYGISLVSAILAMKTKEIAFTLPVVMVIYEFMFFEGGIKKRILYLIPFILTMLIIPLTLIGAAGSLTKISGIDEVATKISETQNISRLDYLYTQFRVIVTYIRLLFLPINQNIDYDYPLYNSFLRSEVFISFLFLLSILILGAYLYRISQRSETRDRQWFRLGSFGILWFFVTLSVESSIIPIRDVIFEHRVYLPSVGFFISLTSALGLVSTRWENKAGHAKRALVYVMVLVVFVLSATTYARNSVWKNSVSLWKDVVKKSPNKARPHLNLGFVYYNQNRIDEAIREYKTALKLSPDYAEVHNNLGAAYGHQNRIDEAIREYKTALRSSPDYADAHYNLGVAYHKQGHIDEAINEYKIALMLKPDYADAHNNLGNAYADKGSIDAAVNEFKTALMLEPDLALAHNNLGIVYFKQGSIDEAINEYKVVLMLKPDYAEVHNNLGAAYFKQGRIAEAISEIKIALMLKPDYADARKNLEDIENNK